MAAGFKTATVNASDVPASQSNFPAYVDLSRLGITTQAEADSVRVYADSSKTTEWAREIVSTTEMWVKIPSLTSTTDIYVDWDGTSSDYAETDTYGKHAVWSGYLLVLHMTGASATAIDDSTSNSNDVTSDNGTPDYDQTGKIGQCVHFDQVSDERLVIPDSTSLDISGSNITMQAWRRSELSGSNGGETPGYRMMFNKGVYGTSNYYLAQNSSSASQSFLMATDGAEYAANGTGGTAFAVNTWQLQHSTHNGSTREIFVNGTSIGTSAESNSTWTTNTASLIIACDTSGTRHWRGDLDEIRIIDSILSANWITTEYNNQNDEATFWGTWSTVSAGTTFTPKVMMF